MNDKDRINMVIEYARLSAKKFAESLGMKRVDRIYNVQKGKNKISPALAKLITTNYKDISYKWLIDGTGDMFERHKPIRTEESMIVMPPQNHILLVPLVQQYAYGGYLTGYGDAEYVDELPKIPFIVDHEAKGAYVCFEVRGDSMDDGTKRSYCEGDLVLCRSIHPDYWRSRLHYTQWDAFVIVHRTDGVIIKQIIDHDVENGIVTVHSFNPFYADRKIDLREVTQLFNVIKIQRNIR